MAEKVNSSASTEKANPSKFYIVWAGKFLELISRLPMWWLYRLSDLIFPVLYYIVRYRRNVARANLAQSFPEKTEKQRRQIEYRFFRFFCDYIVETIKLISISPQEMMKRMKIYGAKEMDDELNRQPFVFLMLGHFGNWEWVSSFPLWSHRKGAQLYKPLSNPHFDKLFLHIRSRFGAECISRNDALRRILSLKKEGIPAHIGFIADQSPKKSSIHDWIDFLHQDTPIYTGAERIGKKVGAAAYFAHISRPKRGYYSCKVELLTPDMSQHPDFEVTEIYMKRLEEEIHESPHLWLWSHRRWKHHRNS